MAGRASSSSGTPRAAAVVMTLIGLALNAYFLYYVDQLRRGGCACADGWKRSFMEASLVFFIVWAVVSMFTRVTATWLMLVTTLVMLAYVVVARMFIEDVKRNDCRCAENNAFAFLNVWNWIQIAMLMVYVVLVLLFLARRK